MSPIGPGPSTATVCPACDPGPLDPVQAAGERLHHGGDLGRERRRDGEEVALGDPRRDEQVLGVGAVQEGLEVLAERLLAASARRALAARRRVRGDDATAGGDVDPAELMAERARHLREEERVAAPEGLGVGAVREGHLDLDENVPGPGLGAWHLLDPQVAGAVVAERSHVEPTLQPRDSRAPRPASLRSVVWRLEDVRRDRLVGVELDDVRQRVAVVDAVRAA